MAGASNTREVGLQDFVEGYFRQGAEQLAGGGCAEHLVVIHIPAAGITKIFSGLAPGPRADLMERLAEQLKGAAADLRKQPGQAIFVPGQNLKLSSGAKT